MYRKIFSSTVLAFAIVVAALFAANVTSAGTTGTRTQQPASLAPAGITPTPVVYSVQDSDVPVWLGGWGGEIQDGGYTMRCSVLQGETASFTFTGTAVKWVTDKTAVSGIAQVLIDGANKGNFDLYPQGNPQYYVSFVVSGLTNAKHTIVVKNTGQKNPNSSSTRICVDAFVVGATTYTANSHKITYSGWKGSFNTNASGGSYRYNGASSSQALLHFNGTSIKWVTATGPSYGKAWVIIDGVSKGYVDLYSSTQHWKVNKTYTGLGMGSHTIQIVVLGQKNAASTGYNVVVDAFVVTQ